MKYNDDTIFANLDIFKDIGEVNNKIHGKKDRINAASLLSVKFEDLCSDSEESCPEEKSSLFRVDESSIIKKSKNS